MRHAILAVLITSCASAGPSDQPTAVLGEPPDVQATEEPHIVIEAAEPEATERVRQHATPESPLGKRRITLDVRDVPVRDVLRLLAQEADANIVVDAAVQGRVTLTLRDVSLDDAFFAVLRSQGLGFEQRGQIVLVDGG